MTNAFPFPEHTKVRVNGVTASETTFIHGEIIAPVQRSLWTLFEVLHRAYDGDRAPSQGKWGNGKDGRPWSYGKPWKVGDVVGFACDLDLESSSKNITFYLNGESMGIAFSNIDFDSGLSPAMTAQVWKGSCSVFSLQNSWWLYVML